MILFLMQTTKNLLFGFVPEPLGVLIFAIALIGFAVGLRWFFEWNEEMAKKAQLVSEELLKETLS